MNLKLQRLFLILAYAIPLALIFGRAVADITMSIVTVGFLIQTIITRDFKWMRTPWFRVAIVTWMYLILSGLLAMYDVQPSVKRGVEWIRFPVFAMGLSTWLFPLDKDFKWLRNSLIGLLSLVALDGLIQFVTGTDVFGYARTAYMGRLTGPFGKDNMVVGLYLVRLMWPATGLIFAALLTKESNRTYWLLVPLGFMLLMGATILVSGERMAFFLFVISAGFFCLSAKKIDNICIRKRIIAFGSAFIILSVLLVATRPDLHARFVTVTAPVLENFDKSSYGAIFDNAITAWKMSPVTGVGPLNFYAACTYGPKKGVGTQEGFRDEATWDSKFSCARHPHNPYMEWLAETGIIGLGLFICLITVWTRQVLKNLRSYKSRSDYLAKYYLALGFGVGLVPYLWPIMSSTSFFINWSAILFWWVIGLNYGFAAQSKENAR